MNAASDTVLTCADFGEALRLFRKRLGFRLDGIAPADNPTAATLSKEGIRIALRQEEDRALPLLQEGAPPVPTPTAALLVSRPEESAPWITGRAGMRYRDLIPDRMGGYLIASHIRIEEGGPVPDEVHYHDLRFQLIYCLKGWVRLVYEDQGPPFVLEAGACVLQPPKIRHRVLESSPGLEVVEVACPATHGTFIDHDLALPTRDLRPERDFGGQRFAHGARIDASPACLEVRAELADTADSIRFVYVIDGTAHLASDAGECALASGVALAIPRGERTALTGQSPDLRLLVVSAS